MKKRILSLCVAFVLLCTIIPLQALAVDSTDEAVIYTQYLLAGGYHDILEDETSEEYLDISTCLIDIDKDGVSELLISLTDTQWSGPRGYASTSALLTIKNKTVKKLLSAYYGGGSMGGDALVLKYDQLENQYVIALDGYFRDGVNAGQSYLDVYSSNTFAKEFALESWYYSFYAGYYDAEIAKVRKQTDLYNEDGTNFYFYKVNDEYVSKDEFDELSNRFADPVDSSYQMYSGTYYAPIKGYSAEDPNKPQPDSENENLENGRYAAVVQNAIDEMQRVIRGMGYGALYDADGNGIEELFLAHHAEIKTEGDYYEPVTVYSVYTMSGGNVIPLVEKELLNYEAGDPWGYVGVVRKDGQTYIAATASNGGVFGDETEGGGFWTLYSFDGLSWQKHTDLEYFCFTRNSEVVPNNSYVTINGQKYDYSVYEQWQSGVEEEYAVYPHDYPWSPQYENTMTLEALLEYLKAHPVKDTASGSADEDSAPTKWDTQPTEYAAGDGQQSDTVIPTESGNGAAAFLWIGLVCIVAAVILIWRKKATKLAVAIILIGVLFMGIGAYAKGSADTKTEAAQQEETRTAATEATAAAAVLSQTQVQEIPELETEFRTEEYTKAPTEATVELTPLQYWIEYCDIQRFTQEDLETFDAEECRLARNAIFAKSGRKFNDASLQAYYEQFDWYHPTVSPDSFSNSMLNDIQSYNRDLIVMYEESRGYR